MCDINGEVPLIYLSRIRSFKSGFNYLTLSYMHITERRKIPKCGPFNTLHPHPEMSSTWIEESARKWGRKREREKKLKKFYHIVKKTRQDRSKEIYNPFCDGATKKLLQLNQNRYEAEF